MSFIVIVFALSLPNNHDSVENPVKVRSFAVKTYSLANDRTVLTDEIVSSASEFASANAS